MKGLPPDSALMRAMEPDSYWTQDTELLASMVEGIHSVIRLLHTTHFKKPHPEPIQIPRPWGRKETTGTTLEEFRSMVAGADGTYIPKDS